MVPSDLHFIVRHVLTGTMFMFFVLYGIWGVELWAKPECSMIALLSMELPDKCTVTKIASRIKDIQWFALTFSVIIGITLQGVQMVLRYSTGKFFTDDARQNIAKRVEEVIAENDIEGMQESDLSFYRKGLGDIARDRPDALYVWVYHSDAQDRLVEWARRRRSYHYLGLHFFTAFWTGVPVGLIIGLAINYPLDVYPANNQIAAQVALIQAALNMLLVTWAYGAHYLSKPMKIEADSMEFAWSCGRLYPDFKNKVLRSTTLGRPPSSASVV